MSKKQEPLPPMQNEPNQKEIDKKCAELLKATRPQPQSNGGKK